MNSTHIRRIISEKIEIEALIKTLYLQKHKYGCLPVVSDGRLDGIITDSDFVAVAINLLEQMEITSPEDAF